MRFAGRVLSSPVEDDEPARMVVSEIQLKNSPSCIALDPITARLVIVVGHHIMVYSQTQILNNDYKVPVTDYQYDFEIPLQMKIEAVTLCDNYVSVSSKSEIQVLKISKETYEVNKPVFQRSKSKQASVDTCDDENSNHDVTDDNGIYIDKFHFLWTPEQLDPQIQKSDRSTEENKIKVKTSWFKNLHSCKFDREHKTRESIAESEGHSTNINVKRPEGKPFVTFHVILKFSLFKNSPKFRHHNVLACVKGKVFTETWKGVF